MGKLNIVDYTFEKNLSGRFESRYSYVKIGKSNSIFFKDMENAVMGVWSAHGEGRAVIKDGYNVMNNSKTSENRVMTNIYEKNITMQYVIMKTILQKIIHIIQMDRQWELLVYAVMVDI